MKLDSHHFLFHIFHNQTKDIVTQQRMKRTHQKTIRKHQKTRVSSYFPTIFRAVLAANRATDQSGSAARRWMAKVAAD